MKFFKIRAMIVLIGFITLLGFIAVAVSVRVSISLMDKQNVRIPEQEGSKARAVSAPKPDMLPDMANVNRIPLYFNGECRDEQLLFSDKEGHTWVPLDILLGQIGIPFRLFNGDDTFKINMGGKPLLLKLGTKEADLSEEKLKLPAASAAAENHILAPEELLEKLPGFEPAIYAGSTGVFINYWPESAWKPYSNMRLLKMSGERLNFSDLQGGHPFAYGKGGPGKITGLWYSQAVDGYILRSGDSTYLMSRKHYRKPKKLGVNGLAVLSGSGDAMVWTSKSGRTLYVYDLAAGTTSRHKNYFTGIKGKQAGTPAFYTLHAYSKGKRYVRFEFQGSGESQVFHASKDRNSFSISGEREIYSIIERSGKVVVQGPSLYSPDHRRLLYYSSTKGYCVADSDGTDILPLGDLQDPAWIDHHRIFYRTGTGRMVYDVGKKTKTPVKADWKLVGKALDGSVFFTVGNALYTSSGGKSRLRMGQLPWSCDKVSAVTGSGPLLVISMEKDSVFFISDKMTRLVGRPSAFPHEPGKENPGAVFPENTVVNPSGSCIAMLQKGDNFLELKLIDMKKQQVRTLTLNALLSEITGTTEIRTVWLDPSRLVLFFHNEGWVLDISKGTRLHHWNEKEGETILDILP